MLLRLYNPILASHPTPPSATSPAAEGACAVPAVPCSGAGLPGHGLGSVLASAVTGQSPSCPQRASQCPSGDGACWNRRAWVGTSHVEVPSFSLPGDSLAAAAIAGYSRGVPLSVGPWGGGTPRFLAAVPW